MIIISDQQNNVDSGNTHDIQLTQSIYLHTTDKYFHQKYKGRDFYIIGEIDYYIIDGIPSVGTIDTDVIARHILSKNVESLPKLIEGNYILIIVEDQTVSIMTDRFGKKELFFNNINGIIISDFINIIGKAGQDSIFDKIGLSAFFQVYGNYPPKKHTLFKNISRIGIDEYLQISGKSLTIGSLKRSIPEIEQYSEEKLEEYYLLLHNAVKMRSTSSGINWIYLSSGWDSTAILALLCSIYDKSKIRGVIGRMRYSERSGVINQFEIDRACAIAEYYGITLDIVELDYTKDEIAEYFKKLIPLLKNTLTYSFNSINFALLADFIGQHAQTEDVVFSGEISDGAHNLGFSQYATLLDHPDLNFREYADKMASYLYSPSFLKSLEEGNQHRDIVYNFLKSRVSQAIFDSSDNDPIKRKVQLLQSLFIAPKRIPLYSLSNTSILTEKGQDILKNEINEIYFKDAANSINENNLYGWLLHLYNSFHWQGSTVKVLGKTLERYGKKIKLPFWDAGLQEFLKKMPESWGRGLDLHNTKYPLKWVLKHKVDYPMHLQKGPHSYLYDVNPGFSHLAEILYGSKLKGFFQEQLQHKPYEKFLEKEYFNINYINQCVDDYISGKELPGQQTQDLSSVILLTAIALPSDLL